MCRFAYVMSDWHALHPSMSKLKFQIFQDDISFEVTLDSKAQSSSGIMRQIKGRLLHLMLMKKQLKAQGGIKLNKPVYFKFQMGNLTVNTHEIEQKFKETSSMKMSLRIGNSSKRIKQFFSNVEVLVNFMLRGDKAYSDAENAALEKELIDFVMEEKKTKVKLSKKITEETEVSAN